MIDQNAISRHADALHEILAHDRVLLDPGDLASYTNNTIGLKRTTCGVLLPTTTEEVEELVEYANVADLHLYPISKGKNMGYGDKAPVLDNQWIVDLGRMNQIREYNEEHGYVVIEPGVTQGQLADFLLEKRSGFWSDITGSGIDASIVGNTLEGGFGHSPRGNHRDEIQDIEIVLGNGTIMRTGVFPGLGPDLSGMFVQSNFGIVTAMRVDLVPIPEASASFVLSVMELDAVTDLMKSLSKLRRDGVLTSLVHVGNAMRMLITSRTCPSEYADKLISEENAKEIMSSRLVKIGHWSAVGCLYGTDDEVKARKAALKKTLGHLGKLNFFTHNSIRTLQKLTSLRIFGKALNGEVAGIHTILTDYEQIHGIMNGIPTNTPLKHIAWRVDSREDMGLLWFAPTTTPNTIDVTNLIEVGRPLYKEYGFEMPVTLTLVKPDRIVCIFNISYDKTDSEQRERAYKLYDTLKAAYAKVGIFTYRTSIRGMAKLTHQDSGKMEVLKLLKQSLDPNGVISPGRYGLI